MNDERTRWWCAGCVLSLWWLSIAAVAGEPGENRANLVIPDEVWDQVDAGAGLEGRPLGFSAEEMSHFGRDAHLLRPVMRQFHDVRKTLRFSGYVTDLLLDNAAYEDELVRHAFAELLDEHAGRRIRLAGLDARGISGERPAQFDPAGETYRWGVDWLVREGVDLDPDAAFGRVVERLGGCAEEAMPAWNRLPLPAQRLAVRLLAAIESARPWVENALDLAAIDRARAAAAEQFGETDHAAYAAAIAPAMRHGPMPLDRAYFDLIGTTDLASLGYAAVLSAKSVRLAVNEFERNGGPAEVAGAGLDDLLISIDTPGGPIVIAGTGDDTHQNDHVTAPVLLLDLGGDDTYRGAFAVSDATAGRPVSLLVDLGGDDVYLYDEGVLPTWRKGESTPGGAEPRRRPTLACGLFGIGMAWSLGRGDDTYESFESSQGAAWHGVGALIDDGGDDVHRLTTGWGQGSAFVGLGVLINRQGNDRYVAGHRAQALGMTRGAGVLVEVAGNDTYVIRDDGKPSELYLGQTVAMGQGCGYGRRGDLWDGRSLAGGFGVLVDGGGDDTFSAMAWSQGAAYWWGVGILENRGGDDTYRNGKYSMGAAAHFGVGIFVDLAGDDRYNTSRERMVNPFNDREQWIAQNQYAGHARDGSLGIFVDGGGNDEHVLRANCAGNADLNSIALFWSRSGNDRYIGLDIDPEPSNPDWERPPLGTVTLNARPFGNFRDDLISRGVFLDTGGTNRYENVQSPAANNSAWSSRPSAREWGFGLDINWFGPSPNDGEQ